MKARRNLEEYMTVYEIKLKSANEKIRNSLFKVFLIGWFFGILAGSFLMVFWERIA